MGVGAWSPLRSAPCPRGAAAGFSPGAAAPPGLLFSPGVTAAGGFCAARRRRLSPGGVSLPRHVARAAQPATNFRWHMICDLRSCSTKAAQ